VNERRGVEAQRVVHRGMDVDRVDGAFGWEGANLIRRADNRATANAAAGQQVTTGMNPGGRGRSKR